MGRLGFLALALFPLWLAGCSSEEARRETEVFGTRAEIIVHGMGEEESGAAIAAAFARFQESHLRFHPWREGETARINRAVVAGEFPVSVSAPMVVLLSLSALGEKNSGGVFNPSIGTLISLWGFHSEEAPSAPAEAELERWLQNPPTLRTMRLEGNELSYLHPNARMDFGAAAKGAALDDAAEILRAHGVRDALINIGGNIMALGRNAGGNRSWRVELRPSRDSKSVGEAELRDGEAVSLSGGGERFFISDGVRYHHILDPRTARPALEVWAAGVIAPAGKHAGALSDIAATSLVLAEDESAAEEMLSRFGISAAFRVSADGSVWMTPEMKKRMGN